MTRRRQLDPDEPIRGQVPIWDDLDAALRGEVRPHGTVPMPRVMPPVLPDSRDWGPTFLYRAYCPCGVLADVGVTNNLLSRIGQHTTNPISYRRWMSRVARWDWEVYPTRHAAETAERQAIRTERPTHNRAHVIKREHTPRCRCPEQTTPGEALGDNRKDTA